MLKIALSYKTLFILFVVCLSTHLPVQCEIPTVENVENNNFYDNVETINLSGKNMLEISGEVADPGLVDLSRLPLRTVICNETHLNGDKIDFVGSYRFDGYSLFDILTNAQVEKANKEEFPRVIDMFIEISNDKGEAVIFSWGEVFYPSTLHQIIVATRVCPIIPSLTKQQWPIPTDYKIIAAKDMRTERNIANPSRIRVFHAPKSFTVNKGMSPLHSPSFKLFDDTGKLVREISQHDPKLEKRVFPSIFYGRGKGFHGITNFYGVCLKDLINKDFPVTVERLRKSGLVISALDGYRVALSYSELLNRTDQAEFLLVEERDNQEGGAFKVFPAADFFSDRAVKALTEIHVLQLIK